VSTFEILPVLMGMLLGSALVYVRPHLRKRIAIIFTALCGVAATIASGEFVLSWGYLLVDMCLVGTTAGVTFIIFYSFRGNGLQRFSCKKEPQVLLYIDGISKEQKSVR
jgi:hypothetical protein